MENESRNFDIEVKNVSTFISIFILFFVTCNSRGWMFFKPTAMFTSVCIRVGSWKHPLNYWMLVQGQNLASLQIKRQRANQFSKWQGIYGVTKTAPFFLSTGMSLRTRTSDIENIGEVSHHTRFFWSKSKKHIFLNLNRDNIFTQFMKKG